MLPGFRCECVGHEVCRRTHDALSSLTHHNRDVGASLRNKPPVIAMSMGKDDCEQRRIVFPQARDLLNEGEIGFNRVERQAEINNNPASRRLYLDAGTADLLGAAMDADPHEALFCQFHLSSGQTC